MVGMVELVCTLHWYGEMIYWDNIALYYIYIFDFEATVCTCSPKFECSRLEKCCLVWWVLIFGSEFSENNMKRSVLSCMSGSDWCCHNVGDVCLARFGLWIPTEHCLDVTAYMVIVADHIYPCETTVFQKHNKPCHKTRIISNWLPELDGGRAAVLLWWQYEPKSERNISSTLSDLRHEKGKQRM